MHYDNDAVNGKDPLRMFGLYKLRLQLFSMYYILWLSFATGLLYLTTPQVHTEVARKGGQGCDRGWRPFRRGTESSSSESSAQGAGTRRVGGQISVLVIFVFNQETDFCKQV